MNHPAQQHLRTLASSNSGVSDEYEAEIDEIRKAISADDAHLELARERTNAVRNAAMSFDGISSTYGAGSIAHETVNRPVNDGDAGAVLDRRSFPTLGPDSIDGGGSESIVDDLREHVVDVLRDSDAHEVTEATVTKRAIVFDFKDAGDGVTPNPSVDLIVALSRKEADGLWIPNTEEGSWDASHPEEHTSLLTADPKDLRVHRARLIRLAKSAIKGDDEPVLISFNIEALALDLVKEVRSIGDGLRRLLEGMASEIGKRLTPDPAGVSDDIKLPDGISQVRASERLGFFAERLCEAQVHSDDAAYVKSVLAEVFPSHYAEKESKPAPKSELAKALAANKVSAPIVSSSFGLDADPKPVRSFGNAAI